jgi:hypothetical protein
MRWRHEAVLDRVAIELAEAAFAQTHQHIVRKAYRRFWGVPMTRTDSPQSEPRIDDLIAGRRTFVWSMPDRSFQASVEPAPAGLLPGAFNPLHDGHLELCAASTAYLRGRVRFELSIFNVDKPPLDWPAIEFRRRQFQQPIVLTAAPRFVEKAAVFPGTTFVVGVDTLERIVAPSYYADSYSALRSALTAIRDHGCRFLVAGRRMRDTFVTLADIALPVGFEDLFEELPARCFRSDISSTELRNRSTSSV